MKYRIMSVDGITGEQFQEIADYLHKDRANYVNDYIREDLSEQETGPTGKRFKLTLTIRQEVKKAEAKERRRVIDGLLKKLNKIVISSE